jgi:hypothetical protein
METKKIIKIVRNLSRRFRITKGSLFGAFLFLR